MPSPATVDVSPPTGSTLVSRIDIRVRIYDFEHHDDTLSRLAKAVQLFDANEQEATFHERILPAADGGTSAAEDTIEIEPRAGPGWYSVVVWKVDLAGPGVDWSRGVYWHDAGNRIYANFDVGVSSPGIV